MLEEDNAVRRALQCLQHFPGAGIYDLRQFLAGRDVVVVVSQAVVQARLGSSYIEQVVVAEDTSGLRFGRRPREHPVADHEALDGICRPFRA